MIKKPDNQNVAENFKTITMQNGKFKQIKESNEYFTQFLHDIGFTKAEGKDPEGNDAKYKYLGLEEIKALGLENEQRPSEAAVQQNEAAQQREEHEESGDKEGQKQDEQQVAARGDS